MTCKEVVPSDFRGQRSVEPGIVYNFNSLQRTQPAVSSELVEGHLRKL